MNVRKKYGLMDLEYQKGIYPLAEENKEKEKDRLCCTDYKKKTECMCCTDCKTGKNRSEDTDKDVQLLVAPPKTIRIRFHK